MASLDEKQRWFADTHRGHWSFDKTMQHLKRDGRRWIGDRDDVREWIQRCEVCQRFAQRQFRDPWAGLEPSNPNQV